MTTAYTSLLGLALPVTGELSGTWGDTVNNSITSLLDSAIAGTTTLSSDVDVTLTTTTGAANTSRQAILLWTAGGTATRNITAPAQSKIYTVINASSSTQSIVLRGVGPTTGVTIVKGESAVCAWNGSDFIKISNTGGAAVFTTLDVTNLEVTNIKALDGTSAASIANSTGVISLTANPILSGGTANGVAYLNGSKVLTTGSALVFDGTNLGVGASPAQTLHVKTSTSTTPITLGVLSNATGLPALSFNGAYASTTMAGIYGNGATASSLYYEVPSGQSHFFGIADATKITINSSGNLQTIGTISVGNATPSTSGAGITFPATQSASSNANTLDDYEEGTWTPTLQGTTTSGTFVYSFQLGTYTKIGNTVTVAFTIVITSVSVAAAGPINIINLPFASSASSTYRAGGSIANIQGMQLNGTAPLIEVGISSTILTIYGFNNNAAYGVSDASTIGAGDFINGSITYFV